jgi:hypothetical protein
MYLLNVLFKCNLYRYIKASIALFQAGMEKIQERRDDKARILTGLEKVSETLFNEQRDHE